MSKKIENSEYKEYIDNALQNGSALSEILKTLHGQGFDVSKSTLGNYARNFDVGENEVNVDVNIDVNIERLNKTLDLLVGVCLERTKSYQKDVGLIPSHVYKSIIDLQKIIKSQLEINLLGE